MIIQQIVNKMFRRICFEAETSCFVVRTILIVSFCHQTKFTEAVFEVLNMYTHFHKFSTDLNIAINLN